MRGQKLFSAYGGVILYSSDALKNMAKINLLALQREIASA
jgi:hypothetical protein